MRSGFVEEGDERHMQLRKVTPARAQKGYRNDGDGADRLHQALHERQLLQASDMMHATLMLMSSVVGVPLPKMQQPRQRERRRPSHFWYEDAHTWKIVVCTWAAARQAMVRVRYFLGGEDGAVDSKNGGWRPVHRRGRDRGLAQVGNSLAALFAAVLTPTKHAVVLTIQFQCRWSQSWGHLLQRL
jgi:hypothetical protein